MPRYLIQNATIVSMEAGDDVRYNSDVLIEDGIISKLGSGLDGAGAVIIDGTDCIVSPGFIDAHRHMWQTQLAGLISDHTLVHLIRDASMTPADISRCNTSRMCAQCMVAAILQTMSIWAITSAHCNA